MVLLIYWARLNIKEMIYYSMLQNTYFTRNTSKIITSAEKINGYCIYRSIRV